MFSLDPYFLSLVFESELTEFILLQARSETSGLPTLDTDPLLQFPSPPLSRFSPAEDDELPSDVYSQLLPKAGEKRKRSAITTPAPPTPPKSATSTYGPAGKNAEPRPINQPITKAPKPEPEVKLAEALEFRAAVYQKQLQWADCTDGTAPPFFVPMKVRSSIDRKAKAKTTSGVKLDEDGISREYALNLVQWMQTEGDLIKFITHPTVYI
ncbi:hypothetical protein HK098_004714 [Nowakowskiella sp. JEL0407]|nr:hypothetical protein HK098_004714 [Nowakowskiella sp. JEL0407]